MPVLQKHVKSSVYSLLLSCSFQYTGHHHFSFVTSVTDEDTYVRLKSLTNSKHNLSYCTQKLWTSYLYGWGHDPSYHHLFGCSTHCLTTIMRIYCRHNIFCTVRLLLKVWYLIIPDLRRKATILNMHTQRLFIYKFTSACCTCRASSELLVGFSAYKCIQYVILI